MLQREAAGSRRVTAKVAGHGLSALAAATQSSRHPRSMSSGKDDSAAGQQSSEAR